MNLPRVPWRIAHLPALLVACGALLVVATVVGGVLAGRPGALGAAFGVAVVTVGYLFSTLVIAWADSVNPRLIMPIGLTAYVVKLLGVGAALAAVASGEWADLLAAILGVVAAVTIGTAAQIVWLIRHPPRLEYVPPAGVVEDADGRPVRRTVRDQSGQSTEHRE